MNCPVSTHAPECLCDVIVTEPVPIMDDFLRHSWEADRILDSLSVVAPFADDDVLDFLEFQALVHDEVAAMPQDPEQGFEAAQQYNKWSQRNQDVHPFIYLKGRRFLENECWGPRSNGELRAELRRMGWPIPSGPRINGMRADAMKRTTL